MFQNVDMVCCHKSTMIKEEKYVPMLWRYKQDIATRPPTWPTHHRHHRHIDQLIFRL